MTRFALSVSGRWRIEQLADAQKLAGDLRSAGDVQLLKGTPPPQDSASRLPERAAALRAQSGTSDRLFERTARGHVSAELSGS